MNENGHYRLLCVDTWAPAGGTVWGKCGDVALLEAMSLEVGLTSFPVCSLLLRMDQEASSQMFLQTRLHSAIMDSSPLKR